MRIVKDSTTVRQECRVVAIDTYCDGPNIPQGHFHVLLVVRLDDAPSFDGRDWVLCCIHLTFPCLGSVRVICPADKAVLMNVVERHQWITTNTTLVCNAITVQ